MRHCCGTGGRICSPHKSSASLRTVGVQDGLPVLDDGRVLDVQNVVWCTGFRPDYTWIKIPLEQGEDGYPVQYRGAVDSAPGLYFVGMLFLHSFASMLVGGAGGMPSALQSTSWRGPRRNARRWPRRLPSRRSLRSGPPREVLRKEAAEVDGDERPQARFLSGTAW